MTESNTRSRAVAAAKRATSRLWDSVETTTATIGLPGLAEASSDGIEAKLREGRQNAVSADVYYGKRPEKFDAPALFCYLFAKSEREAIGTIDDACDLFEQEIGSLPLGVRDRAVDRFENMGISAAPDGDDLKRAAAVDTLVDEIAQQCLATQDAKSESAVDEAGLPVALK